MDPERAAMSLGHRMSGLPQSRFCGKAPLLSAQYGSGLAALLSRAYHARCSQMAGWEELLDRLPDDLREEVLSWPPPTVVEVADQDGVMVELDYGTADVELHVALDRFGFSVPPGSSQAVTEGHLDMAWHVGNCAFVADIKRTRWTVPDFESSLQLHAYALAYATLKGATHYRIGLWTPMEASWWWSSDCIQLESAAGARWQRNVVAAATNDDPQATTGPHCANCWGRPHCAEFLLPAALGATKLRALCEGSSDAPTQTELATAVHELDGLKKLLAVAEPQLKALALRQPIEHNGFVWRASQRNGREIANIKVLRERLGEKAEQFIGRAAPSQVYGWHALSKQQ
jgi:hypothetical protein